MEQLKPKLIAKTTFREVSLTLNRIDRNACSGIVNTFCPLEKGEVARYKLKAKIVLTPYVSISINKFSVLITIAFSMINIFLPHVILPESFIRYL